MVLMLAAVLIIGCSGKNKGISYKESISLKQGEDFGESPQEDLFSSKKSVSIKKSSGNIEKKKIEKSNIEVN